jgi:hypothetical protein
VPRHLPAPRLRVRPRHRPPLTLPAIEPVDTYPVVVEDGIVKVELP